MDYKGCVVVQGKTNLEALPKIRKCFEGYQIIYSCWVDDDVSGYLPTDIVVWNEKPEDFGPGNFYLQRKSTIEGMKKGLELGWERALKWRSDMWCTNSDELMKLFDNESLNLYLVKEITKISSKPVFISTGMSFLEEVENIYNFMKKKKNEFLLMHCTSQYPCDFKNLGIGILKNYINHFKCPIGYSDHSGTLDVSLLALESKINALEVHVTFNKKIFNPDASSSIDFKELKFLSNYVKNKAEILKFSTTKNDITNRIKNIRKIFSKSLALRKDMKKNSRITLKDLMFKKPGNGLKEHDIKKIIGKKLLLNKSKNRLIKLSDVN
jgi:sialic acid synthase SpsE